MKVLKESLIIWLLLTVMTGLVYPLAMTGLGQMLFRHQADGSVIEASGSKLGSELIGQEFTNPGYFWSRRSATGPVPYNAASSTGSNQGPLNPALYDAIKGRVDALNKADPTHTGLVPIDLATASGSGLDPDISPAAAEYQIARVAAIRGISVSELRSMVSHLTEGRQFGLFGEPRVNVLALNLALDRSNPLPSTERPHG